MSLEQVTVQRLKYGTRINFAGSDLPEFTQGDSVEVLYKDCGASFTQFVNFSKNDLVLTFSTMTKSAVLADNTLQLLADLLVPILNHGLKIHEDLASQSHAQQQQLEFRTLISAQKAAIR